MTAEPSYCSHPQRCQDKRSRKALVSSTRCAALLPPPCAAQSKIAPQLDGHCRLGRENRPYSVRDPLELSPPSGKDVAGLALGRLLIRSTGHFTRQRGARRGTALAWACRFMGPHEAGASINACAVGWGVGRLNGMMV